MQPTLINPLQPLAPVGTNPTVPAPIAQNKQDLVLKINFCTIGKGVLSGIGSAAKFAGKSLAGLGVVVLNLAAMSVLYAGKLGGFAVMPAILAGAINIGLTEASKKLGNYTWKPLQNWTDKIACENDQMLKIASNVFSGSFKKTELNINLSEWGKLWKETGKAVMAPISLAMNAATGAVFVGTKPTYLAFLYPGIGIEFLTIPLYKLNKLVSKLSFTPLQNAALHLDQIQARVRYETGASCTDETDGDGCWRSKSEILEAYGNHLPEKFRKILLETAYPWDDMQKGRRVYSLDDLNREFANWNFSKQR